MLPHSKKQNKQKIISLSNNKFSLDGNKCFRASFFNSSNIYERKYLTGIERPTDRGKFLSIREGMSAVCVKRILIKKTPWEIVGTAKLHIDLQCFVTIDGLLLSLESVG